MMEDEDHWAQRAMSQKGCAVPAFPLRRGAAGLESVATMNLAGGCSSGQPMLCATADLAIEVPVSRCSGREGDPGQQAGVAGAGREETT